MKQNIFKVCLTEEEMKITKAALDMLCKEMKSKVTDNGLFGFITRDTFSSILNVKERFYYEYDIQSSKASEKSIEEITQRAYYKTTQRFNLKKGDTVKLDLDALAKRQYNSPEFLNWCIKYHDSIMMIEDVAEFKNCKKVSIGDKVFYDDEVILV